MQSLIPVKQVEAIVCSHQDPDLCMAISDFEKAGFKGVICCHDRTAIIIKYYDFKSPFYLVNHHEYAYTMQDGHTISFLFTPYLHFPGSIMSYLREQQALISGDVFSSISADWTLYADDNYIDGMIAFHEVYMPGTEILADAMGIVSRYELSLICPQHGSVIKDDIPRFIDILKNLPCGLFLEAKKRGLPEKGEIIHITDRVLARLITTHGIEDVRKVFRGSGITINGSKQKISKTKFPDRALWNTFFSIVEDKRGAEYLYPVASLTERICNEFELPLPPVFSSLIASSELQLMREREALQETRENLKTLEESLYRDPITKLYNQHFYEAFMKDELQTVLTKKAQLVVLLISIDNLDRINLDYGNAEGDKTMRIFGDLLNQIEYKQIQVCRLSGGLFALVCQGLDKKEAILRGDSLRSTISEDERFIVPISASMGLYHSEELPPFEADTIEDMVTLITQSALFRLKLAKKQGGGELIHTSVSKAGSRSAFTILLIDHPGFDRDLIQQTLEKDRFRVIVADDGLSGKKLAIQETPDLILCELLVGKLSGITLRKELLNKATLSTVPFILMSINKNEQTIKRAYELNIRHFLRRPVALYEIVGLITLIMEKGA